MVEGHPIERELCSTRNNWKPLISNTGHSLDQGNSFLCIHFFSFLFKKQREREGENERELPSAVPLPQIPHKSWGLDQVKARNQALNLVLPHDQEVT